MNQGTDTNVGTEMNRGMGVTNGTHRIFVYGSLLPGMENAHLLWPNALSEPVPGSVRGRMVEAEGYPALLLAPWGAPSEARVRGLWTQVGRDTLRELDSLEVFSAQRR